MAGVPGAVIRDISVAGFVDNTQEQQVPGADKQNITYVQISVKILSNKILENLAYNPRCTVH
jgi:hypothetical protein